MRHLLSPVPARRFGHALRRAGGRRGSGSGGRFFFGLARYAIYRLTFLLVLAILAAGALAPFLRA